MVTSVLGVVAVFVIWTLVVFASTLVMPASWRRSRRESWSIGVVLRDVLQTAAWWAAFAAIAALIGMFDEGVLSMAGLAALLAGGLQLGTDLAVWLRSSRRQPTRPVAI